MEKGAAYTRVNTVDKSCSLICRLCLKNKEINMLLRVFSFKKQPLTSFCLRCVQILVCATPT